MRILFHSASRADRYLMEKVAEPWGDDGVIRDANTLFGGYCEPGVFDCAVVLGDRLDALRAAVWATECRIPLAHIHGGEITRGSMDNKYRNAITQLADIHFCATEMARIRLCHVVDGWQDVHHVGAPGLDGIEDVPMAQPYEGAHALVTVSPALEEQDLFALARLLDLFDHVTITASSVEPGSEYIDTTMKKLKLVRGSWHRSLGKDYLPTLKSADVVIGNSSSGIIEAPSLGTPTINIGNRQDGREHAGSVFHCGWDSIGKIGDRIHRKVGVSTVANPYYKDGKACESIHRILTEWLNAQGS